jgi:hypothetical protein
MSQVQEMLSTHPRPGADPAGVADVLHELEQCRQTCTLCADACLSEEMVADLRRCIRLNLDCAALCSVTAEILGRQTEGDARVIAATLDACAAACDACAQECQRHAEMHAHCRTCADACRRCAEACRRVMELAR